MKYKFLLLAFLVVWGHAERLQAQWIQSLTVLPTNPTANDTITVLAECSFPSGNCDYHNQYMSVNGNTISGGSLHCLGALTIICYDTDTFKIDPLPAGNYTFHFQIDAGFGPGPCTPGIVPGPSDTVNFTVSPTVGIAEIIPNDALTIYPNPVQDQFLIMGLAGNDFPVAASLFSSEGKLIKNITLKTDDESVSVKDIPPGLYQLQGQTSGGQKFVVQMMK